MDVHESTTCTATALCGTCMGIILYAIDNFGGEDTAAPVVQAVIADAAARGAAHH